jgi:undecaprenyl-diphosphatase
MSASHHPITARRSVALWLAAVFIIVGTLLGPVRVAALAVGEQADAAAAGEQMTAGKAAVLGVVEGVTEFLPISSTGHLLVTQRILGIGDTDETKDAADAYAIAIQAGAILAVVLLYFGRLKSMALGVFGRDPDGRRVFLALVLAFLPAAVIALALEAPIKDNLLGVGPVIIAWLVGGVVILVVAPRWERHTGGLALEQITARHALIIGFVQVIAIWPGTSRSLVTILAALAVGMSLAAAVEFSFLLGLVTLGAATSYEVVTNGSLMIDAYGWLDPLIGLLLAFVSAALAIRWMVGYLQKHSLAIFGWYRIAVAGLAVVLLWTGVV